MYWFSYFFIVILNFITFKNSAYLKIILPFAMIYLWLFIGARYEVGGDWDGYLKIFNAINSSPFVFNAEFAYYLINILAYKLGGSIVLVNLICSFFSCVFLYLSLKRLNYAFASLLYLFPFALVVITMGFTRQGVALFILLFGFLLLVQDRRYLAFIACVLFAAMFHKSAIFMLLLLVFSFGFRYAFYFCVLSLLVAGFLWLYGFFDSYMISYVLNERYHSKGAIFRASLHLLPVFIYLFYRKKIVGLDLNSLVLDILSVGIIFLFILSFFFSTAVDRAMFYFYIYDILILDRLLVLSNEIWRRNILILLVIYTACLFGVWYFYSHYALHFWRTGSNLILGYLF